MTTTPLVSGLASPTRAPTSPLTSRGPASRPLLHRRPPPGRTCQAIARMDRPTWKYITSMELRDKINHCRNDIEKRILIMDVRDRAAYNRSHLCLDERNMSISTKVHVMNIDPDLLRVCSTNTILANLSDDKDRRAFERRKDLTDVVIVERNTDNASELASPKSKVTRLINALTRFDNQPDNKIRKEAEICILKGGYRDWVNKYKHFTTNSSDKDYDPDEDFLTTTPKSVSPSAPPPQRAMQNITNHVVHPQSPKAPLLDNDPLSSSFESMSPLSPWARPTQTAMPAATQPYTPSPPPLIKPSAPPPPPAIIHRVPQPPPPPSLYARHPEPTVPPKTMVKNAPGTAVPVTPNSLHPRPALPRSHSSPNVAQAEGDELDNSTSQLLDKLVVSAVNNNSNKFAHISSAPPTTTINGTHHVTPSPPLSKPRFDRTLKPAFNIEAINLIRAQINFGRSPETSGKAITGLQNLGNTCFMNSVIQCLAYAPSLVSYFCSNSYYNHINFSSQYATNGELAVEFGALVEKLNSHRYRYIEPKSFRDSVTKHIGFAGNEQQDSHEFMMMLFDKLHHDLNIHAKDKPSKQQNGLGANNANENNTNVPRATLGYQFWKRHLEMNKSIISDLFEGIFMSTLTCTFCRAQSNTFEVFNCLSLPIPSDSRCHVRDCLRHFSNPERIEAAWECPVCKQKREADKKIVICKLPKILIIHLKRFSLDGRWRQKLQTTVDFPLNDLAVECINVLPQSAYGPDAVKSYNLCAVVNHYGHLDGGHYTAFCKLENQRWYTFDDSNVTDMKDADVCSQAAYILFYAASC